MPTQAFNEFLYEFFTNFFNFGKFVKIREFFAEVMNSQSTGKTGRDVWSNVSLTRDKPWTKIVW